MLSFLIYFLLSTKVILPLSALSIEEIFLIIIFGLPTILSFVRLASFFNVCAFWF